LIVTEMPPWPPDAPDEPPFDITSMSSAQIARFSDPGGGIVWAADSPEALEALRTDAEWVDDDPDSPPGAAELSPLDFDREGLALALFVIRSPGTPADYELPAYQRALIDRYEAGTLTPMVPTPAPAGPPRRPTRGARR
jgi:hypothetical protein